MAGGGQRSNGRDGALSEINVTPLVDVMLVLLVVFMVTTPIIVEELKDRKVEVDLPETSAQPLTAEDVKHMILDVHADYRITFTGDKEPIELVNCTASAKTGEFDGCLAPLEEKLKNIPKIQEEKRLFLQADRALPYGFVVDVMARIKNAGVTNLGMVTHAKAKGT